MNGCVNCGEQLPEGARFCPACGAEQTAATCVTCGAALLPGARFCFSCGTPVPARPAAATGQVTVAGPVASRRVTSVLFGDLVGFTALSEHRDQEDVRELLSGYFEESRRVIARYGGTVEKFIGDAVMAVWGVPTAHEDDAERAVRAGLELVDAVTSLGEAIGVAGLAMRVGVVTGEVAVTVGATQQGMVAGDAVNTASRVQSAATPGQVWVDETTRLLTSSAITYVDVGSHVMKGKTDPVPLWAVRAVVAAVGGAQRADGLEAPLVGRDRELRMFKDLFHATEDAQRPLLLVVEGDAGVGKTRLAWEFEKYADGLSGQVAWHRGRCLAYGEGVAFFALAEAIRGRLRSVADASDDDAVESEADVLEQGLERFVPDQLERDWLRPRLGSLLGIGSVGSFPREDLFSAWGTFLERAGAGNPVVLVIDDAQNADEGLLQFVEHLLAVAGYACFVVLLTRPGLLEGRPALAVNRRATVVHLEALPPAEMGVLLGGLVAGLSEQVRERLVERAEGVPLYAVETVRSLIDRDLVVPRGGQYVLAPGCDPDLETVAAPPSLQALVAARLDGLTLEQRRVVDRASVVGESFSRDAVIALSPDVEDVEGVLDSLLRQQILSQETRRFSAGLGRYSFVQTVVRQVAYSRLSRRDRKALHLAVAAQMESGSDHDDMAAVVAQHYLDAVEAVPTDPDADELRNAAVNHLEQAAVRAAGLGGPDEAAAHLTVALSLAAAPEQVAALEASLGECLFQAGRYDESCQHAERAEQMLADQGDRMAAARAAVTRCRALSYGPRDHARANAILERWWEELRGDTDELEVRFLVCSTMVAALLRQGVRDWALMETEVTLAERAEDPKLLSEAYVALASYFAATGSSAVNRMFLRAAADLARSNHDPVALAKTLNNLSSDSSLDDLDNAVKAAREGNEVARKAGLSAFRSVTEANLLMALFARGDWEEVVASLDEPERAPDDNNIQIWWAISAMIGRARGTDPPLAVGRLSDDSIGDDVSDVAWQCVCEALTAERHGDGARASALAREAVEHIHRITGLWEDLPFVWPLAADLSHSAGQSDSLDSLMGLAGQSDRTAAIPLALRAHWARSAGLLAHEAGHLEEAERLLRSAVDGFAAWGSVPYGARAALELAACLDELGRPDEAEPLRRPAVLDLQRLGAEAWLAQLARAH
jgi:class 3 adenylate cyclase/tetratricopeptide (TPR) repeat protein